jgi:hypothetical protein
MPASVRAALAACSLIAVTSADAADKSTKPRLAVLELAAPGGGTSQGRDGHEEQIEVFSVTWGTTRSHYDALTDGLLILRYNQDGSAAVPASLSRTSKVEALAIKQKMAADGGTDGAVTGNTKWKNIVLKRGAETSAAGGVRVAVGDVDGDGRAEAPEAGADAKYGAVSGIRRNDNLGGARDAQAPRDSASGQATGKRQHMPIRVRTYDAPLPSGSVLLKLSQPWPACAVGDRFNGAYLVVGTTHRYQLGGATIAGCSADAVAVNYRSIIAQERADY